MDYENKEEEFTVQGRDTPVPVRGLSGRAGSPGPSSRDRLASSVGNQAGSVVDATDSEGAPFARRGLARTPPQKKRGRVHSLPETETLRDDSPEEDIKRTSITKQLSLFLTSTGDGASETIDLVNSDSPGETRPQKKRREIGVLKPPSHEERRDSPSGLGSLLGIADLIKKLDREIRSLKKIVGENRNTKVEIKDSVNNLAFAMRKLTTRENMDSLQGDIISRKVCQMNGLSEVACQTDGNADTKAQRNVATQTEKSVWQIRNDNLATGIREKIATNREFDGYKTLPEREWPQEAYIVTKELEGNPIWEDTERDIIVMAGVDNDMEAGILRQVRRRFPEIMKAEAERRGCACVIYESRRLDSTETRPDRKTVSRIHVEESEKETYKNIERWKGIAVKLGVKRVALLAADGGWNRTRRMWEHVMWDMGVRVFAYILQKPTKGIDKRGKEIPKRREQTNTSTRTSEAVIVSASNSSYADLVKMVKHEVDPDKIGAKVTNIRSTKKGELLLTVDKEGGNADALSKEIMLKLGEKGITARTGGQNLALLHIKGMDVTTTAEELRDAIIKVTGNSMESVSMISMRPAFDDSQNATIKVTRKDCELLITTGKIRVKWSSCKVQERIDLRKCQRCWGFGHSQTSCPADADRRNLCLKCGKEGHRVKECQNEPSCPRCEKQGHRADTMMCPLYRKEAHKRRKGGQALNRKDSTRNQPERKVEEMDVDRDGKSDTTKIGNDLSA